MFQDVEDTFRQGLRLVRPRQEAGDAVAEEKRDASHRHRYHRDADPHRLQDAVGVVVVAGGVDERRRPGEERH